MRTRVAIAIFSFARAVLQTNATQFSLGGLGNNIVEIQEVS